MKIETKFNMGDEVWFMENNKVKCDVIREMKLYTTFDNITSIKYRFREDKGIYYFNDELFATKQELLDSL